MASFFFDFEIGQNKLVNSSGFVFFASIAASIGIHGLVFTEVVPSIAGSSGGGGTKDWRNVGVIELNSFERSRLPDLNPSSSNLPATSEVPGLPPIPGADNSISALPDLPPLGSLDSALPPIASISPPPSLPSVPSLPALPRNYSSLPSPASLPIRPSPNLARLNGRSIDISRPLPTPPPPSYPPNFRPPSVPTLSDNNSYADNSPSGNFPSVPGNNYRNNPRSNPESLFNASGEPSLTPDEIRQASIRASQQAQTQLEKPGSINSDLDNQQARARIREWEEQQQALRWDNTNTSPQEESRNLRDRWAEIAKTNPDLVAQQLQQMSADQKKSRKSVIPMRGTYPPLACSRQLVGTATYLVTGDGAGNLVGEPKLIRSAGYRILNQQAALDLQSLSLKNKGPGIHQVEVSFAPTEDVCPSSNPRPRGNESSPSNTRTTTPPAPDVQPPTRNQGRPTNPRPENTEKPPVRTSPPAVEQPKVPQPSPAAEQPKAPQPSPAAEQPNQPQPAPPVEETKAPEPEGPPAPAATTRTAEPAPEPPKPAESPAEAKPAPAPSPGSEG